MLTLESLIEKLFEIENRPVPQKGPIITSRTFPANTLISKVNQLLGTSLPGAKTDTLEDLMTKALGHTPSKLETARTNNLEFTLASTSLLSEKTIKIRSI